MTRNLLLVAAMILTGAFFSAPAMAQEPQWVETSRDWDVFTATINGQRACFIVSKPKSYSPEPDSRHGDVFFYVTRRAGVEAEPSIIVGFDFLEGREVTVTVGDQRFAFMTQGRRAFINDPAQTSALITAMRAGSDMRVSGSSARPTDVAYTFSLSGVTAGLNRSARECN